MNFKYYFGALFTYVVVVPKRGRTELASLANPVHSTLPATLHYENSLLVKVPEGQERHLK